MSVGVSHWSVQGLHEARHPAGGTWHDESNVVHPWDEMTLCLWTNDFLSKIQNNLEASKIISFFLCPFDPLTLHMFWATLTDTNTIIFTLITSWSERIMSRDRDLVLVVAWGEDREEKRQRGKTYFSFYGMASKPSKNTLCVCTRRCVLKKKSVSFYLPCPF